MKLRSLSYLLAVAAAAAVLAVTAAADRVENRRWQRAQREAVRDRATVLETQLERELQEQFAIARALATFAGLNPDLDDATFDAFAQTLLLRYPDACCLFLARPTAAGYEVVRRSTRDGVDWPELDIEAIAGGNAVLDDALQRDMSLLSAPVELGGDRWGAAALVPAFDTPPGERPGTDEAWGFAGAIVPQGKLLARAGIESSTALNVVLLDNTAPEPAILFGDPAVFEADPLFLTLSLPDGSFEGWMLAAVPEGGWSPVSPLTWWLRGGGIALASLAAFSVWTMGRSPRRRTSGNLDYERAVDTAPVGVLNLSPDGEIAFANDRARNWLQRNGSAPKTISDDSELRALVDECLRYPDRTVERETSALNGEGQSLRLSWYGKATFDDSGQPTSVLCWGRDISERSQRERDLQALQQELRVFFAAMSDRIWTADRQGTCLQVAPTQANCFPGGSLLRPGAILQDILPSEPARQLLNGIRAAIETQSPQQLEYRIETRGKIAWFSATVSPQGEDKAIVVARQITDLKQAELALQTAKAELEGRVEERAGQIQNANKQLQREIVERMQVEEALRQSEAREREKSGQLEGALAQLKRTQAQLVHTEKMSSLGQLVAGVAHEINNPANFIHGNLAPVREYTEDLLELIELFRETYPDLKPEIQEFIEEVDLEFIQDDLGKSLESIQSGTERIRQIVLSLRSFSRLDEADRKLVDIRDGLESTLLILRSRMKDQPGRPDIQLVKEFGDLPKIDCYAGQLNQVFTNILVNAIDALNSFAASPAFEKENPPRPLEIKVKTQTLEGDRILIRISDTGEGMSEETRARIFDPFFTTKPVGKGTGLGLSIGYQIVVEKHGGALRCYSRSGEGSTFEIELPVRLSE